MPPIDYITHGSGDPLKKGDLVEMHYVATLTDGTQIDSSRARDEPFTFELGAGHVIEGWELIFAKLRIGDHVTATIPPDLAYGVRGVSRKIPPGSTIRYDIEVLRVVLPPTWEVLQTGDGPAPKPGQAMLVHHVGTRADGTEYVNTRETNEPSKFLVGSGRVIEGWDRVVGRMRVGDRWKLRIPWVFAYGTEGRPIGTSKAGIPGKMDLVDDIEVLAVSDAPSVRFVKRGNGPVLGEHSRAVIRFTGKLADGTVFDSSAARGDPFRYRFGTRVVVDGWDEVLPQLRVGDRCIVRVPWVYGYGLAGHGNEEGGKPPRVPPKADLDYDIEVLHAD